MTHSQVHPPKRATRPTAKRTGGLTCALLLAFLIGHTHPVSAATTTITGLDTLPNTASIHVTQDGRLELPNGAQTLAKTIRYGVSMNGVYTFHTVGSDESLASDAILVDTLLQNRHITNQPVVQVGIHSADNQSGIESYRLKNERTGSWSAWHPLTKSGASISDVVDWKLDTSKQGIRTVYAQFKDQAGNITDSLLSSHGNTKEAAPFAEVVFTTQGPTFDARVFNDGLYGTNHWAGPNRPQIVARHSDPYVELIFHSIKSAWSIPDQIFTSFNNQPYTATDVGDLRNGSALVLPIPKSQRVNGPGAIRLYVVDAIGNASAVQTIPYYYDDAPAKADVSVKQNDGTPLKNATSYNQDTQTSESVKVTETDTVSLDVAITDAHSSITPKANHPGFARIKVEELTRTSYKGNWTPTSTRVYGDNKQVAEGEPFTALPLKNATTHRMKVKLSPGLETKFRVHVTDNAGNTTTRDSEVFKQSNLQLISFKILSIVNPKREDVEVNVTNQTVPQEVSAGGDVTVEPMFHWLSATKPKTITGEILVTTANNAGYSNVQTLPLKEANILRDKEFPRFEETFTVPADAPIDAMVNVKGHITITMPTGLTHTVYFPSQNKNISQQIGVVENNIQDAVRFNITR